MNILEERLYELKKEFSELEDDFERYAYLVELAAFLPPYPEERRTKDRLIQGCQSQVWVDVETTDGRFHFTADSDTLIIKGALAVLDILLNDAPVTEVANMELNLLAFIGMQDSFSAQRQKGIHQVVHMLKQFAQNRL